YNITEQYPLCVYAKDIDNNGSIDPILSCYFKSENGEMVEYPVHFWDELYGQSPLFRNQFSRYRQYGLTDMKVLLEPHDVNGMEGFTACFPYTSYVENNGNCMLTMHPLPIRAQISTLNGIVSADVNGD